MPVVRRRRRLCGARRHGITLYKGSTEGETYDWDADANGWATHMQMAATYVNAEGTTVIPNHYGNGTAPAVNGDRTSFTLANAGYLANYRAFDVTKPISDPLYAHDGRSLGESMVRAGSF